MVIMWISANSLRINHLRKKEDFFAIVKGKNIPYQKYDKLVEFSLVETQHK